MIRKDRRLKLFDKIYNKRLVEYCNKEKESGNAADKVLVKAKDNNMYIIEHFKYPDDYDVLSKGGKCYIIDNRMRDVGILKYMNKPKSINCPAHMLLCDINIKRKNIGLGSIVIKIFEKRAVEIGVHYITGELSSIDERTEESKQLRDAFYIKHGYRKITKELIKS